MLESLELTNNGLTPGPTQGSFPAALSTVLLAEGSEEDSDTNGEKGSEINSDKGGEKGGEKDGEKNSEKGG